MGQKVGKSSIFDLDLSDSKFLRGLGIFKKVEENRIRYVCNDLSPRCKPFPENIEEAAHFVLGLSWVAYPADYKDCSSKKKFLGLERLKEFLHRGGPEIIRNIYNDLGTSHLTDLSILKLLDWIDRDPKIKQLQPVKYCEQIHSLTRIINGKEGKIKGLDKRRAFVRCIEANTGYAVDSLHLRGENIVANSSSSVKKGQDSRRHRFAVEDQAKEIASKNTDMRFADYYQSNVWKEATEKTHYTHDTVKDWTRGVFNSKPGRPKIKT